MVEVMELRKKEKRIFEKLLNSHRKMEYESERDAVAVGAMIEKIMKEAHEPIGDTIQCTREEAKELIDEIGAKFIDDWKFLDSGSIVLYLNCRLEDIKNEKHN